MAAECAEAADGLHVNEDHFLVEAVDPVTAEPVPDGTPGELVFSTLTREAGPLLRYRTGDIAALRRGPCPCGRTLVKMSQVTGRRDDMLVIRGVNIYPSEVERVLLGHTSLSPDYLLVVDERAAQSQLLALCEYAPDSSWTGMGLDRMGLDRTGLTGRARLRRTWNSGCVRSWGCGSGSGCCPGARCRALRSARRCGSSGGPGESLRSPGSADPGSADPGLG